MDIDGNEYKTAQIGKQLWMAENLNVSHYRNGDKIPQVQDVQEWLEYRAGGWCYYDSDTGNGEILANFIMELLLMIIEDLLPKVGMCRQMKNGKSLKRISV